MHYSCRHLSCYEIGISQMALAQHTPAAPLSTGPSSSLAVHWQTFDVFLLQSHEMFSIAFYCVKKRNFIVCLKPKKRSEIYQHSTSSIESIPIPRSESFMTSFYIITPVDHRLTSEMRLTFILYNWSSYLRDHLNIATCLQFEYRSVFDIF